MWFVINGEQMVLTHLSHSFLSWQIRHVFCSLPLKQCCRDAVPSNYLPISAQVAQLLLICCHQPLQSWLSSLMQNNNGHSLLFISPMANCGNLVLSWLHCFWIYVTFFLFLFEKFTCITNIKILYVKMKLKMKLFRLRFKSCLYF